VGIKYDKLGERCGEMNFQYKKWVETLTKDEVKYPSARILEATLNCNASALKSWGQVLEDIQKDLGVMKLHHEWQRDWELTKASELLGIAELCFKSKDSLPEGPCVMCQGTGKIKYLGSEEFLPAGVCPACMGSGKFPAEVH
jgi:hypothetical protein